MVGPEDKQIDVDAQILGYLNDMEHKHDQKQAALTESLKSLGYVDDGKTQKIKFLSSICSGTHSPQLCYCNMFCFFAARIRPYASHPCCVAQIKARKSLKRIKLFKPYAE